MRVFCSSSHHDLEGHVDDDSDLDGVFILTFSDTGERLSVNGWLFIVERINDAVA